MRVLLVHNRYRVAGGEERHVDLLEQSLRDAGADVRRFERDSTELVNSRSRRVAAGMSLVCRPGGGGITPVLKRWQPDIVHFHNIWPQLTPAAMRIARRSGATVVFTAHNYRFACPGGTLLRGGSIHEDCIEGSSLVCALRNPRGSLPESVAYGIALEVQRRLRLLERWVDAFVAPSAFMAGMLVRAGLPASRIHVIAHGLPAANSPSPPGRYALFIGRLSEEKGVRTLLEAAQLVPDVPVVLAGGGPLEAVVREAPSTYLGRLGPGDIRDAICGAAYTIVPSEWYENLPFAALESFAVGKSVIATSMGGLAEIVENGVTGLLVPPRSPDELADAMQRLWTAPDLIRKLGANAFDRAQKEFALATQTGKITALYESLQVASGSRSRA